jgi:hypothetical protein
VLVDPKPQPDFTVARTRGWAQLCDFRYGLLLGFLEHYLRVTDQDRFVLVGWIFAEMRSRVAFIARQLTTMPSGAGDGRASVPFTLPAVIHLPADLRDAWIIHRDRTREALATVAQLRADPVDQANEFLTSLEASDKARLAFIQARIAGETQVVSFARDIAPLFRTKDIQHMRQFVSLDLADHSVVQQNAQSVVERLKDPNSPMPPAPDPMWTAGAVSLLERWIATGMAP